MAPGDSQQHGALQTSKAGWYKLRTGEGRQTSEDDSNTVHIGSPPRNSTSVYPLLPVYHRWQRIGG